MELIISNLKKTMKRTFNIKGRANRKEYVIFTLLQIALMIPMMFMFDEQILFGNRNIDFIIFGFCALCSLITLLPGITLMLRRLHDINFPSILGFLLFIPFGSIVLFFLCLLPSVKMDNKYGSPEID